MIILVDDLGFADVGYRENTDLKAATPYIDSIAAQGIKLDYHYVQMLCSPTRASMLTGRYAFRLGFQAGVLASAASGSLPLDETTMAELLQAQGYHTGLFGKWHLGIKNWDMLPNQRGFDSYHGYYAGGANFWTKIAGSFLDLHNDNDNNEDPKAISESMYSQYVYQEYLNSFLRNHAVNHEDEPFFIYSAMQTVHSPLLAPEEFINHPACSLITDEDRQIYCGMVLLTDSMIENTFEVLQEEGFDRNTIVLFSNDNGGNPSVGGYNMPLRGQKGSTYEGGIRSVSFLWSALLPAATHGTTYSGLLHLVDWLPTFMALATDGKFDASKQVKKELDGFDVWDAIINNSTSPRTELVHNADSSQVRSSALRVGDYKLILYQQEQQWTPIPSFSYTGANISAANEDCTGRTCNYLFNIKNDPTETTNLILLQPERAQSMRASLETYMEQEAPCESCKPQEAQEAAAAARTNNGYWTPWTGTKPSPNKNLNNIYSSSQNSVDVGRITASVLVGVGVIGLSIAVGIYTYRKYFTRAATREYIPLE